MYEKIRAGKRGRIVVVADGELWKNPSLPEILRYLIQLKEQGHYVSLSVYGDYQYHPGIPDEVRRLCRELLGDAVVVNKLMSDEQVRVVMRKGGRPIFSLAVEDYLVEQAGGHPLLAGLLAEETFHLALSIKLGWERNPEWKYFWREIMDEVKGKMGGENGEFGRSLRYVREAGFDPKTWGFEGDSRINREVYVNMLPRNSVVFREWLDDIKSPQR